MTIWIIVQKMMSFFLVCHNCYLKKQRICNKLHSCLFFFLGLSAPDALFFEKKFTLQPPNQSGGWFLGRWQTAGPAGRGHGVRGTRGSRHGWMVVQGWSQSAYGATGPAILSHRRRVELHRGRGALGGTGCRGTIAVLTLSKPCRMIQQIRDRPKWSNKLGIAPLSG